MNEMETGTNPGPVDVLTAASVPPLPGQVQVGGVQRLEADVVGEPPRPVVGDEHGLLGGQPSRADLVEGPHGDVHHRTAVLHLLLHGFFSSLDLE